MHILYQGKEKGGWALLPPTAFVTLSEGDLTKEKRENGVSWALENTPSIEEY